jgi:hypothetical protein
MKVNTRRVGVAALALILCLSVSPAATAAQPDGFMTIRETITRLLKKLRTFGGIALNSDQPGPPRPTP